MEKDFERQFLEVYKQNTDAIFRYCLLRVSDRELAKDIAQDTFMKVWQYAQKGEIIANLRAFLFTTAKNLIIDHYRKKQATSLDGLMEQGFDVGVEPGPALVDQLDGAKALALLGSIPDKYRDAIYLQYVEGLSIKEIADVTEESENNISVRIHRGLQKLRSILRDQQTTADAKVEAGASARATEEKENHGQ